MTCNKTEISFLEHLLFFLYLKLLHKQNRTSLYSWSHFLSQNILKAITHNEISLAHAFISKKYFRGLSIVLIGLLFCKYLLNIYPFMTPWINQRQTLFLSKDEIIFPVFIKIFLTQSDWLDGACTELGNSNR